jgi:hypothetical protein
MLYGVMKKKKPEPEKTKAAKANYRLISGSDNPKFSIALLNQAVRSLFLPESWSKENRDEAINAAIATLMEIAPKDGLEGVLAAQMVATHNSAMECIRRAALENQTFEGRNMALNHAQKLLRLYLEQMKALNKHRGKGDQKVVIEHVNVAPGGQAIVGNIETGSLNKTNSPPAITHHQTPMIDVSNTASPTQSKAPVKNAKRKK